MDNGINLNNNPPLTLSERQKWLCQHLDTLNSVEHFCPDAKASNLFKSALYLTHKANHDNLPDWMAEAAHSIRELLYPLSGRRKPKPRKENIKDIILLYQEEELAQQSAETIHTLFELFTKIAHHDPQFNDPEILKKWLKDLKIPDAEIPQTLNENIFSRLIELMEIAWQDSNPMQISLHENIDKFLAQTPGTSASKNRLQVLLSFNIDARMYFYSKANDTWAEWLWENGFLDVLKTRRTSSNTYQRTPELSYVVRIAETAPEKTTRIMLAIPISTESVNPELIERFLWVCRSLPSTHLGRIIPKLHRERWVQLLGAGNQWFEHEKIIKSLYEAGDYSNLLLFADSLLGVRSFTDSPQKTPDLRTDTPFHFEDLCETKIFIYLAKLEGEYERKAFEMLATTFGDVIRLNNKPDSETLFISHERFPFFDVDFFTLKPSEYHGPSYRKEVVELAALLISQTTNLITQATTTKKKIAVYEQITAKLPESAVSWRMRFYVLSLDPICFIDHLQKAFFKIFDSSEHRNWLTRGPEYKRLLQCGFRHLPEISKRQYIERLFTEFNNEDDRHHGSILLSMIWDSLSPEEMEKAARLGFSRISDYKPHPSTGKGRGGWVRPTSPISEEELALLTVPKIAELLRTDWTPVKLHELNKAADFLAPINPEGLSDTIKTDFLKRPKEYLNAATLFFDRDTLSPHYTYAFLRMIPESFKDNILDPSETEWTPLIKLFSAIKKADETTPLEPLEGSSEFHAWVAGWKSVYSTEAELLTSLLHKHCDLSVFRADIVNIIEHLLRNPDPTPAEEIIPNGAKKESSTINDPYSIAINSVRGKAFETFVAFTQEDWNQSEKRGKAEIAADIKLIYESLLKAETTRAIRFLFGKDLAFFYSRDKVWISNLMPQIFTPKANDNHLYLASWEGYLSTTLYSTLFFPDEFQRLYIRGLHISTENDPRRNYFTDPCEGLGTHIGLAFGHFDEFTMTNPLFIEFWTKGNSRQQAAFITAIGSSIFSNHNSKENEVLKEKPETLKKIELFWDWLLRNSSSKEVLTKLGVWINPEHVFFNLTWLAPRLKATLEKTNGTLEWTHGLTSILPALAAAAPSETAAIARMFFFEAGVKNNDPRNFFHWDDECYDTLKVLFGIPETKEATKTIINDMLRYGDGRFWKLKEILNS